MPEDWQNGGFGLYVHWPFCESKCPYCDFNSHVTRSVDQPRWLQAFRAEIDRVGAQTEGRVLRSVFFGGGTPSLMEPDLVAGILDRVQGTWTLANDVEITLEANPGSVEAGRFRGYRDAGVNRVSVGIQALNNIDLKRLGRLHSVKEARAALEIARATFDRFSFDLIYARQDQQAGAWRRELREALAMAGDHLSLYQLTIEKGTAFGDRYDRGLLAGLPDEDLAADLYEITQEECDRAGLPAYEISNHARPGQESRHNMIYWGYGDYAGIGPGAHGRLTRGGQRFATVAYRQPDRWLAQAEAACGDRIVDPLGAQTQADELLMMGLRVSDGISMRRYEALAGKPLSDSALRDLEDLDLVRICDGQLRTTPRGRMVLNSIIRMLLPE